MARVPAAALACGTSPRSSTSSPNCPSNLHSSSRAASSSAGLYRSPGAPCAERASSVRLANAFGFQGAPQSLHSGFSSPIKQQHQLQRSPPSLFWAPSLDSSSPSFPLAAAASWNPSSGSCSGTPEIMNGSLSLRWGSASFVRSRIPALPENGRREMHSGWVAAPASVAVTCRLRGNHQRGSGQAAGAGSSTGGAGGVSPAGVGAAAGGVGSATPSGGVRLGAGPGSSSAGGIAKGALGPSSHASPPSPSFPAAAPAASASASGAGSTAEGPSPLSAGPSLVRRGYASAPSRRAAGRSSSAGGSAAAHRSSKSPARSRTGAGQTVAAGPAGASTVASGRSPSVPSAAPAKATRPPRGASPTVSYASEPPDELDVYRGLVLDCSYRPINVVCWKRALCLEIADKVDVLEYYDAVVRSTNQTFPIPAVLRVSNFVHSPKQSRRKLSLSRNNIFLRDKFRCQYCGCKENLTIDHVKALSRGGGSTWENLVTACSPCNLKKGDKSPTEAGMKLMTKPREPRELDCSNMPPNYKTFRSLARHRSTPPQWLDWLPLQQPSPFASS